MTQPKIPVIFHMEYIADRPSLYTGPEAQQIFEKWIEENGKIVYGDREVWFTDKDANGKNMAFLICPTEIPKKCGHPVERMRLRSVQKFKPSMEFDGESKIYADCECGQAFKVTKSDMERM